MWQCRGFHLYLNFKKCGGNWTGRAGTLHHESPLKAPLPMKIEKALKSCNALSEIMASCLEEWTLVLGYLCRSSDGL